METRVVRLLTAIVVLLVILLVGGGIAVGVGLHTAQTRQQAAVAHLVETSSAARQALARFEAKRRAYSGDPRGSRVRRRLRQPAAHLQVGACAGLPTAISACSGPWHSSPSSSSRHVSRSTPSSRDIPNRCWTA